MTGGNFVYRLARHFGVLCDEIPIDLPIDIARLPGIDADCLSTKLGIFKELMGGYFWVLLGPPRPAEPEQGDAQQPQLLLQLKRKYRNQHHQSLAQ